VTAFCAWLTLDARRVLCLFWRAADRILILLHPPPLPFCQFRCCPVFNSRFPHVHCVRPLLPSAPHIYTLTDAWQHLRCDKVLPFDARTTRYLLHVTARGPADIAHCALHLTYRFRCYASRSFNLWLFPLNAPTLPTACASLRYATGLVGPHLNMTIRLSCRVSARARCVARISLLAVRVQQLPVTLLCLRCVL